MARRRKQPRPIVRRLVISIGGRAVKRTRDRLTLRQAVREVGEDRWFTRGDVVRFTRRAGIVSIAFEYLAVDQLLSGRAEVVDVDPSTSILVARQGGAL